MYYFFIDDFILQLFFMFLQYVPSPDVMESWLMPTLGVVPPPYSPFVSCEDEPMRCAQGGWLFLAP
jgi:hypothetical protein